MRVHLVTMPWQPIDLPSLQLGLLNRLVRTACPGAEVTEFHGSLRWAEYLLERSGGRYGLQVMCEGGGMANALVLERL